MNNRVNQLRHAMSERNVQAMLVASPVNRRYLTGFTGSAGYVLVTEHDSILLTDFRYMTQAPAQAPDFQVVEHAPQVMDTVRELLTARSITKLGFEKEHVSYSSYTAYGEKLATIELVQVSGLVEGLRL